MEATTFEGKQVVKKQNGFTLIELLVVIMILGILSVTAAPKFLDLSGDARLSTVKAMKGTIDSALSLGYAKAKILGEDGPAGTITVDGASISLSYGYPDALWGNLTPLLNIDINEWSSGTDLPAGYFYIYPSSIDNSGASAENSYKCAIKYTGNGDESRPEIKFLRLEDC